MAEAIEGLSYTVTGLPAPAQCALRVVAYHRYCLQDLDGVLRDETLRFTTAIEGTCKNRFSYIYNYIYIYIYIWEAMKCGTSQLGILPFYDNSFLNSLMVIAV